MRGGGCEMAGGPDRTRCSVVLAGGLEEDWMELRRGVRPWSWTGWQWGLLGSGSLDRALTRCTQLAAPGFPVSLTGSSRCKFLCPQLTNVAAPVLLGYEPLL